MHALIVDDSRAMRRILCGIANELGFKFTEAENGRLALDRLHETDDVDLVLVDWNMPVMDGLEFVQTARADDRYKNLKIVMVTSETEPTRMARALMAGVDEFVMKPFTKEILVDKLALIGAMAPR
jgi:two-component system chemotaxis response regulator CheY